MRLIVTVLIVVCLGHAAIAAVFRAKNRLHVIPINKDTFEVIEDLSAGASDMWCAAADYARRAGLDGVRTRLYVVEPRGPSKTTANATGVVFTTNPSDKLRDTPPSYSVSVKRPGENLTVGHAYNFCAIYFEDVFDGF